MWCKSAALVRVYALSKQRQQSYVNCVYAVSAQK